MNASPRAAWPEPRAVTQPYWWPLPPLPGSAAPLDALVHGEEVATAHGRFFRRRTVFPLDERYGPHCLGEFLSLDARTAAALARRPELGRVALDRAVFLDTETTGLAGGTGTYAFLVGVGSFQRGNALASSVAGADAFVLDQCLMRTYAEERAMLYWLAERLEQAAALVSFNGLAFDQPLLQTRFVMSRLRVDLEGWPHFDLLHPARRLWRLAVGTCALQNLERHVLGVTRQGDVESFLIPAIYHQYLQDGDARYVQKVFEHNLADVLALVAIATRACLTFAGAARRLPDQVPAALAAEIGVAELLGLGRLHEQLADLAAAERAYRAALDGPCPRHLRCRAAAALAALLKRTRRHDEAAAWWQVIADEWPAQSAAALVELAKYWEHQRRDPARAYEITRRAQQRWLAGLPAPERPLPGLGRWPPAAAPVAPDDFARRLRRLDRKRQAGEAESVPGAAAP